MTAPAFVYLGVYPRRDAYCTLLFMEWVIETMPFPIQRIQTDRGSDFFAKEVQRYLMDNYIKFRPIPPRSPHLNGKVERSQLTDKIEFWLRHSRKDPEINKRIQAWPFEYNWRRPHGSLGGKTPVDKLNELSEKNPFVKRWQWLMTSQKKESIQQLENRLCNRCASPTSHLA